jgi:myo-inositol 2-dehydrogenase/D-chiro-inositol 1-dehydrogenase
VKVGLVGAGRMGGFRARVLAEHPEVDELFVASGDGTRARAVAAPLGARAGTFPELLASGVDALVVSTRTGEHPAHIAAGAARALPILCEKPIALTLAATSEAIEAAERGGARLQIGFDRRFDPGFRRARGLIRAGRVGTIYSIHMAAHDRDPAPAYGETSGGIFRDLHIHDFDMARWLTGLEVDTVYATGSVRKWEGYAAYGDVDTTAIVLTMSDGALVLVSGKRHDPRGYDFRAEVFGELDSIAIGVDARTPIRSIEDGAPPPSADPYTGFLDRFGPAIGAETQAFVDFVHGRCENPCPPADALEAMRVAIACDRSRAAGRPVRVADVRSD